MRRRIKSSPVEMALARESLRKTVQRAQIQALMMEEGEDCRLLLVDYATIVGTSCEAGAMLHGREPWVRQLHGALRTIIDLCLDGYRWRRDVAMALQHALEVANVQLFKLPNQQLTIAFQSAMELATRIKHQAIQGNEVLA